MKLVRSLFNKQQSIWGKPLSEYDQTKRNALFTDILTIENGEQQHLFSDTRKPQVSQETELYLMVHA